MVASQRNVAMRLPGAGLASALDGGPMMVARRIRGPAYANLHMGNSGLELVVEIPEINARQPIKFGVHIPQPPRGMHRSKFHRGVGIKRDASNAGIRKPSPSGTSKLRTHLKR
jgi:hypothetical protein